MSYREINRLWNTVLSSADKLLDRDRMLGRPLRIHIEVNDFCNLKCPHCPRENPDIPKNTGHIPIEAVRNLAPWFKKANYVGLAGNGEPFLHPQIMDVLRCVTENGAAPSVISNATLWKKYDYFHDLVRLGPMLFMVSFDGGTKETFEKWRKRANFEEVQENLMLLKEAKEQARSPHPVVNFIVCLMRDTIGEVENIVDIAAKSGVSVVLFQNMYPYVGSLEKERVKDLAECNAAIERARARARQHGIRIDYLPMSMDVDDRSAPAANGNGNGAKKKAYHCDNVWQQMHVTVKGEVKFCCFWTEGAVGDLTKDDLGDLWNGEEWRALRRDLRSGRKPGPCVNCHNLQLVDKKAIAKASLQELKDLAKR
ncbi:MAG: radical SAM protein [Sumerlaeia bacterium]